MDQYALIISEKGVGFTVNEITAALRKQGTEVQSVSIKSSQIIGYVEDALCVIMAGGCSDEILLYKIWHICDEHKKYICLYGTPDEIYEMRKIFKGERYCTDFVRPVEMDAIAEWVDCVQEEANTEAENKQILVVDDNGVMLRTVMGWLEGRYNVSLANSAASAFRAISKSKPDLILLDYEMPVCSGAQFMQMLADEGNYADIPVIFLTSRGDAQTVREVMQLKPKGYILKSSPQEQLLKSIDDYFKSVEDSLDDD